MVAFTLERIKPSLWSFLKTFTYKQDKTYLFQCKKEKKTGDGRDERRKRRVEREERREERGERRQVTGDRRQETGEREREERGGRTEERVERREERLVSP